MDGPVQIGRYVLYDEIASGGMAKVHLGRLSGPLGFSKTVAIKRIHPHLLGEPDFLDMFVDETRLAARIQHPNVVSTLDAVVMERDVFLVMELVIGETVGRLVREARRRQEPVPCAIAVAIACDMLRGLHAAHETKNDLGEPLSVVHRDVSPQNVMVGVDGVARILDFGVAKASGRLQATREGQIKGKVSYMAPEQLGGGEPDRRTDVYAASVVLWEALAGRRLFEADNDAILYSKVIAGAIDPPSRARHDIPPALDQVIMRGLARDPAARWNTAEEMALALESVVHPARQTAVGEWVRQLAGNAIAKRSTQIAQIERGEYVPPSSPSLRSSPSSPSSPSAPSYQVRSRPHVGENPDSAASNYGASLRVNDPPKRSWVVPLVLGVASILALTGISLVIFSRTTRHVTAAPAVSLEPPAAPAPLAVEEEPPVPSASATAEVAAQPTARAHTTSNPRPRAPKATCDPPWALDAKGIKRFKPECM